MLKKTITYIDFNDTERTEDFYFNLTEAEIIEMEMSVDDGFTEMIRKIINSNDEPSIMREFKNIILKSYGEKSADGKHFVKSEEISKAFSETNAYSKLFMELITSDTKVVSDFIDGIISGGKSNTATNKQNDLVSATN